jgi:HK97 family phage prohead protease
MLHAKTMQAQVKASEDDGDGVVEALVATYDLDSGGDRIVPGAFDASLKEWADSGQSIPFIWSHLHDDLDAYLGDVLEAKETDEGLWVKAQIDMDDERSRKAYRLIKGGRVRNYSFAYEVLDAEEKDGENLLKALKVFEVGPTLIGMNQNTRTLAAKRYTATPATEVKRGRVLSSANETSLREAHDAIGRVLAQLATDDGDDPADDEGKSTTATQQDDEAQPTEPQKADEPHGVKADEAMPRGPVDDDLALIIQIARREMQA